MYDHTKVTQGGAESANSAGILRGCSLDARLCWDAGIVGMGNLGPRIIPTPENPSGRNLG